MQFAVQNGIINIEDMLNDMKVMREQDILNQHPYEIWTASDGRVKTYLYDESKKNKRRLIARSTREKINQAIIDDYDAKEEVIREQEREKIITFDKAYHMWLDAYVEDGSLVKGTADRYNVDYRRYYEGTDFANKPIEEITSKGVILFLKDVLRAGDKNGNNLKKKAFVNIKSIISGTFKYAKTELELDCIPITHTLDDFKPSDKKFTPHIVRDEEQVFNDEEVVKIAKYIMNNYETTKDLGILLVFLTGLRVGELAALKTTDQVGDILYIQRSEIKEKCKDGKTHVRVREYPKTEASANGVQLSSSAIIVLNMIKKLNFQNGVESDYLFYRGGRRYYVGCFDHQIRKICNMLNIPVRSMHKARKTYASALFANEVEEKIVQGQLRHKSSITTHRYYEFSIRAKEYKRDQLNNADPMKDLIAQA